jgi:3-phenylpropionate/trans-cinnamate dioxygenase ferredoxin reductase subunit
MRYDVVIVGAGDAGAQAAMALRERSFDGSILMVGGEGARSGAATSYRLGSITVERAALPEAEDWAEQVDLWLGDSVTAIDTRRSAVTLRAGGRIGYGHCILAGQDAALAAAAGIATDAAGRTSCPKVFVVTDGATAVIREIVNDLAA